MNTRNIIEFLHGLGVQTVDSDYRTHIDEWVDWYRGKVDKFHSYTIFNGIRTTKVTRASLGMAKTICEDWANLLLNERVGIAVDGDAQQARLDELLAISRFGVEGNRTVERAFATGTGAFSEYLDGDGVPRIDYHDARHIWPLAWHGSEITECAFSSVEAFAGRRALYMRIYRKGDSGSYRIENHYLDYESGKELPIPEGVEAVVETGIDVPLFQIITPNLANNVDTTCPMGLSVFANAIDSLMAVDAVFDSFRNEFLLGRKRLLVPVSMTKVMQMEDGAIAPIFDTNDMVYTAYQPADEQSAGFHDLSPEIRAQAHLDGMRTQLNLLSFKTGLGTNRYEFDKAGGVKTATEVVSEQSDLYQALCKHELVLRSALESLAAALLAMSGMQVPGITVTFDDSIIQDRSSIRQEAREEISAGLMSKYRYLTEIAGMSEQEANEELERIRSESRVTSAAIDFFGANNAD